LALITTLATFALADTIRLKDGSIIKGRIASFSGGKFVIDIGEGSRLRQLTFEADEVESISFDSTAAQTSKPASVPASYTKPEQKPPPPPQVIVTETTTKSGQTQPQPPTPPNSQPQTSSPTRPSVSGSKVPPIQWGTKVLADNTSNGWTNAGWVVKKGQRIKITGEGSVSLGKGQTCSPSGISELEDDKKLIKSVPTGALIAVIGDDNNEFIYIGAEREFTATRDGTLFLGINEGNLNDNSGSFNVKIEIITAARK
jgi:hypothetical protein